MFYFSKSKEWALYTKHKKWFAWRENNWLRQKKTDSSTPCCSSFWLEKKYLPCETDKKKQAEFTAPSITLKSQSKIWETRTKQVTEASHYKKQIRQVSPAHHSNWNVMYLLCKTEKKNGRSLQLDYFFNKPTKHIWETPRREEVTKQDIKGKNVNLWFYLWKYSASWLKDCCCVNLTSMWVSKKQCSRIMQLVT